MRVWVSVGALQNERASSSSLFSRGAAQRRADCFVSTATAPHASSCHDRRSPRQRRQLPPVLPPCAHPSPPCAACRSFAREHTRALRAHVRHFSFFAFTLHRSIPTHCLSTHKGWTFLHTPSPSPSLHLPSRDSPQPATEKSHFFRHFPRISSPLSLPRQLQNQPPSR